VSVDVGSVASFTAYHRANKARIAHITVLSLADHSQELAALVVLENGKNMSEALASVAKGNETVEWACSVPQLCQGKVLQVCICVYS
jgi:acyl-CoA reductase-like NAD-dependent aldehyde dehydrogenase